MTNVLKTSRLLLELRESKDDQKIISNFQNVDCGTKFRVGVNPERFNGIQSPRQNETKLSRYAKERLC
jgi:hypothetical protein